MATHARKRKRNSHVTATATADQPSVTHGGLRTKMAPKSSRHRAGMTADTNWMQLQAMLRTGNKCKPSTHPPETVVVEEPKLSAALTPVNDDFSITKHVAMDCEMVGVGHGATRSALARITLVNAYGNVIYDKHVRPMEPVTDFRTKISGIRRRDLKNAEKFSTVQQQVAALLKGKILVGHALHNDMKVLFLSHPKKDTRDTHVNKRFRSDSGRHQSLQVLAAKFLGAAIQQGEHSPVEDARASMLLYQRFKHEWETKMCRKKSAEQTSSLSI